MEILPDSSLIVRAPYTASMQRIINLVKTKLGWIFEKQHYVREMYPLPKRKEFTEGEEFLYLGESHKLRIVKESDKPLIYNDKEFLLLESCQPEAMGFFEEWYKKQAFELIGTRAKQYAEITGLSYSKFRISNAKRRWGSCSAKGRLNFSWRLIMAPLSVVDYVIVHELAHLEVRNHSKAFWRKVEGTMPNYKQNRKWLKENGHLLYL